MKNNEQSKCLSCKWGIVGKFSHIYGGCPIGCIRKGGESGKSCFEPKEEKK